jgi:hypothetical protein
MENKKIFYILIFLFVIYFLISILFIYFSTTKDFNNVNKIFSVNFTDWDVVICGVILILFSGSLCIILLFMSYELRPTILLGNVSIFLFLYTGHLSALISIIASMIICCVQYLYAIKDYYTLIQPHVNIV